MTAADQAIAAFFAAHEWLRYALAAGALLVGVPLAVWQQIEVWRHAAP